MPIVTNIRQDGLGAAKFIMYSENTHVRYANFVKKHFNVGAIDGDSDHFVNIVNKVMHIAGIYNANPTVETIDFTIKPEFVKPSGGALRSWLSAVLCCMMYGCDDRNNTDIHIANKCFKDGAVPSQTIPGLRYLEIWKNKFHNNAGGHGNSNDGTVANLDGAGGLEPGCKKDSFNYVTMDSLAPHAVLGYHNMVGAFHDQLFVIPLKEYDLDGVPGAVPEWKKKYKFLCGTKDNCNQFFDRLNGLNIKQKIFLNLSARSINAVALAPTPLKLAAALISRFVTLPDEITASLDAKKKGIPGFKTISCINFYKTADTLELDGMVSDTLYLGLGTDGTFRATYPLTPMSVNALKSNKIKIQNMTLKVNTDFGDPLKVISAKVVFNIGTKLSFIASPNLTAGGVAPFPFVYPIDRTYKAENIRWIQGLPTICMYPNLSSDMENRCAKFTYFSRKGAYILLNTVRGLGEAIDLTKGGLFLGSLDGGVKTSKLIDFSPDAAAPYKNVTAYGSIALSTTTASKAEHFIRVSDELGNQCLGYVLNLRTLADGDIPSLLADGAPGVNIGIDPPRIKLPAGNAAEKLRAFIDFGSSSSYVRFGIGDRPIAAASLNESLVQDKCTLRRCLTEYASTEYKSVINDPENNCFHKFLSNASRYNPAMPLTNELPYIDAWMPIMNSYKDHPGIQNISTSHKTDISVSGKEPIIPKVILNNLCYTIACNAVNNNCNKVEIVPSLPSDDYFDNLLSVWDTVVSNINDIFPDIKFINCLKMGNHHLLYESVAVSLGNAVPAANELSINVDIGDGTTDMSAIYFDAKCHINLCGYSSIEYAGKNLMKTVVKDVLENAGVSVERIFIGDLDGFPYGPPMFKPNGGEKASYKKYISDMINVWNTTHDNDMFESKVMDILDIATLNSGVGAHDQKVAANFILRYMILMPVIKDFIHTAIKIAGNIYKPKDSTINIYFKGGAAKGIELFSSIDKSIDKRKKNAWHLLEEYFANEFTKQEGNKLANHVSVTVSKDNDKQILIDGLCKLNTLGSNLDFAGAVVNKVEWNDKVNPKYIEIFGKDDSPHKNAIRVPFQAVLLAGDKVDTNESKSLNQIIINSITSYFENPDNPFEEFKQFFNAEIYGKLIDNQDTDADVIENLIVGFANNAPDRMIAEINSELSATPGNSFVKATKSSIYPEMMKSSMFMFTISKLLSKYHGPYNDGHTIRDNNDVPGHEFGG